MAANLREKTRLQADQLLDAAQAGMTIGNLQQQLNQLIAGDTREPSPRSGRQHSAPRYGVGGYEDHPYDDFGTYRGPTIKNPNPGQLFDWANQMRISPQVAELYLPGERGSTPGGLGNMNKDSLERWIKENGITGAGADKIRNKWKGLQGDINLPLVQAPSQNGMLISQALQANAIPNLNQNEGDKILNPRGDFKKKPTLKQIREHRDWYLKQA